MDVAFSRNSSGKLTFAKDSQGGFFLDDRAVYAVFATLFARKGEYAYDPKVGTYLYRTRKDGRLTGTRLSSAATDALEQVRQDKLIASGTSQPERLRTGSWVLRLRWSVPGSANPITGEQRL